MDGGGKRGDRRKRANEKAVVLGSVRDWGPLMSRPGQFRETPEAKGEKDIGQMRSKNGLQCDKGRVMFTRQERGMLDSFFVVSLGKGSRAARGSHGDMP
jgi:hypothetical protein